MVLLQSEVGIPALLLVTSRGVQLHKTDASLYQTPRHQALNPKVARRIFIEPVKLPGFFLLAADVHDSRGLHLHSIGQLVVLDPGLDVRFSWMLRPESVA